LHILPCGWTNQVKFFSFNSQPGETFLQSGETRFSSQSCEMLFTDATSQRSKSRENNRQHMLYSDLFVFSSLINSKTYPKTFIKNTYFATVTIVYSRDTSTYIINKYVLLFKERGKRLIGK
jgi:hypothetical protein